MRRLRGESLARIRESLTREKIRNESRLNEYRQLVPASFQKVSRQISRRPWSPPSPGRFRNRRNRHPRIPLLRRRHRLVSQPRIAGRPPTPLPGRRLPLHHHRGPPYLTVIPSVTLDRPLALRLASILPPTASLFRTETSSDSAMPHQPVLSPASFEILPHIRNSSDTERPCGNTASRPPRFRPDRRVHGTRQSGVIRSTAGAVSHIRWLGAEIHKPRILPSWSL
jgi:hypothetical protein